MSTYPLNPEMVGPAGREKFALRVLEIGAVAVVLACATYKIFELDRFFVPKDLTLHLTALLAGVAMLRAMRNVRLTIVEVLLLAYVALGVVSAVFATNHWLAIRALTLSASGVTIFLVARALRDAGLGRRLIGILALAVVVGVVTSLLQTYGVRSDFFSINRAPGGTLGNRNFVAHLAAFGLPVALLAALRARDTGGYLLRAIAVTIVLGTLVLTRSRAAWLAFAGVLFVFGLSMLASRVLRRDGPTWRRMLGVLVLGTAGILAAVFIPNRLRWASDNPYLDSMKGVANYQEGSGQGRLIQYEQSLKMAAANPILGVGPGNWAVVYPKHAARRDPSMNNADPGTTSNPWPSSDWIAFISERGFAAAALLLMSFVMIGFHGMRRLISADTVEDALEHAALIATLAAFAIAGAFDAVLLLALPTLLIYATLGALWSPPLRDRELSLIGPRARRVALGVLVLVSGLGVLRSSSQLVGMALYKQNRTASLVWSARIDPGSYRAHLQLARGGRLKRTARCDHARAARSLYPNAGAARDVASSCGKR